MSIQQLDSFWAAEEAREGYDCPCGRDTMDPDDLDLARDEYEEGYYRRKNGAVECHCCRPRKWTPAEAFSDTGFDEGRRVKTVDLAESVESYGYDVEYEWQDCYNRVILSIKYGDHVIYDRATAQGTPEEQFAALPLLVRMLCLKAVWMDLDALRATHEVSVNHLTDAKAALVEAMRAHIQSILAHANAGGDLGAPMPLHLVTGQ
jgi:hypothetical protein